MMDPSEKNSFDEQWKKAFQEASEIPPLSAWKGIEARLDKEEEKVIPLGGKRHATGMRLPRSPPYCWWV
jgi:hypothetical protein